MTKHIELQKNLKQLNLFLLTEKLLCSYEKTMITEITEFKFNWSKNFSILILT